jgi:hypothetical protein
MERMLSVLVAVVVLLAVPTLPSHSATALSAERMGTITGGCQTGPCGNTNPANRCNHPLCESKTKPCSNCTEDLLLLVCLEQKGGAPCADGAAHPRNPEYIDSDLCGTSLAGGNCEHDPQDGNRLRCSGGFSLGTNCGGTICKILSE